MGRAYCCDLRSVLLAYSTAVTLGWCTGGRIPHLVRSHQLVGKSAGYISHESSETTDPYPAAHPPTISSLQQLHTQRTAIPLITSPRLTAAQEHGE